MRPFIFSSRTPPLGRGRALVMVAPGRRIPLANGDLGHLGGRRAGPGLLVEHEVAEDAEDAEPKQGHLAGPKRQPAPLVQHLTGAPAARRAYGRLHARRAHLLRAHLVCVRVAPPLLRAALRHALLPNAWLIAGSEVARRSSQAMSGR